MACSPSGVRKAMYEPAAADAFIAAAVAKLKLTGLQVKAGTTTP